MEIAMFAVSGVLVDVTREIGDFIPPNEDQSDESKRLSWDYTCLHVLVGREVLKVRLPKGVHVHPFVKGDPITVDVTLPPKVKMTATLDSLGLTSDDVAA